MNERVRDLLVLVGIEVVIVAVMAPLVHDLPQHLIHLHQRCGYSVSPFVRKDTFLYCRIQKWVGGGSRPWVVLVNSLKTHSKKHIFHPPSQAPGPGPAKKDEKY